MNDIDTLTLTEIRNGHRAGDFTAQEVVTAFLSNIEAAHYLNIFITNTADHALAAAQRADSDRAVGRLKPLSGVPLGIKDLFCTKDVRTTAASRMLADYIPPYESTTSQKLWDAGAGMLGKLNMDEFAMGSSNENSYFGNVISPWQRKNLGKDSDKATLSPGGSSGGSAAAVAARLCPAATGTDTGGSIRQPAAFSGITGMKPTYGRCSRWGIVAFASSLDQAGPMAQTVRDCTIMLAVMAGFDPKDATSFDRPVPDWEAALSSNLVGKRVGIPKEYRMETLDSEIAALWDRGAAMLQDAGADLVPISLPHSRYALPTYYIIAPAEASSNLARYDGVRYGLREMRAGGDLEALYADSRAAGFGAEVKRRIMIGTYVLSAGFYDAYYTQAQKLRTLIQRDFTEAFTVCDVILTPTAPTAAFALGEKAKDPLGMYLNDVFAVPASLAGLPAISVPTAVNNVGLPLGLQLIGPAFDEQIVLNAGLALEERAGFTARAETWW